VNTPVMDADVVIVGAGIIGTAIAQALAPNHRVLLLEQHPQPGQETSSHNSEVIHAGIYYPPASLKAQLCRDGRDRLYAFCAQHRIPHRRLGKLVVAQAGEEQALAQLQANAAANGVMLQALDRAQLHRQEPAVQAGSALLSVDTGIIDSHALLHTLLAQAEQHQAQVIYRTRIEHIEAGHDGFVIHGHSAGEAFHIRSRGLVNAAGLHAHLVAQGIDGLAAQHIPAVHYLKGHYFRLHAASPFHHLVYPLPDQDGLGIHATLDLQGQTRFGPDTLPVDTIDYSVADERHAVFTQAIRRYWPGLPDAALQADSAGIRPRLARQGFSDFRIDSHDQHGIHGLVNLFGMDSPGLTACLAIADTVKQRLFPA